MTAPARGPISSRFGEDRGTYTHNGTDIAIPSGTELRAPFDGVVDGITTTARGGVQLFIRSIDPSTADWVIGMAHLSRVTVDRGQPVYMGQAVARSGNTGNTTGAHVHITLRDPSGEFVDPERFLAL